MNIYNFTKSWIESWNSHDLDKILSHYSDDFEITTPMIKVALGVETGTLKLDVQVFWRGTAKKLNYTFI